MVFALALALAALCVIAAGGSLVAALRDSRRPVPTVWGYDNRHPLP